MSRLSVAGGTTKLTSSKAAWQGRATAVPLAAVSQSRACMGFAASSAPVPMPTDKHRSHPAKHYPPPLPTYPPPTLPTSQEDDGCDYLFVLPCC